MPTAGTVDFTARIDYRKAESQARRFQQQVDKGFGRNNAFSRITSDTRDFEKTLGSATNRVVAFGAAAVVFNTLSRSVTAFVDALTQVDKSLTDINVNLNLSQKGIQQFGASVFNIARQTGQTFEDTAKAAAELARQGLSADETLKRLKDSLVLSRTTGLGATESVEALTAALNSFNEEALTSTEVINKFAAVDTKFAVSSKDLAEGVSRVGSTAQAAGVGIDQLIGLITSLQQTTARGGTTIGNGLKTIFTRIQAAPETVSALESIGVAIKNTDGSLRSAIDILRDYGRAREKVGEVERQSLDRTVAGTFQINVLKAALSDLSKSYSVYDRAVATSNGATDEAIRKNEQLNKTIASLFNSTSNSVKELVNALGAQDVGPFIRQILSGIEEVRKYLSGDAGDKMGTSLGQGILHGLSNVLSGPVLVGLTALLIKTFVVIGNTIRKEAQSLFQINNAASARARIQETINTLLKQATTEEYNQVAVARGAIAQKEALLAIQARLNRELLIGTELQNALSSKNVFGQVGLAKEFKSAGVGRVPTFADPIASSIQREAQLSGLSKSQIYVDRDSRVASASNPGGLLVANTRDEPRGGFQGVNRVIAQGGNPKLGSVPGFANTGNNQTAADVQKLFDGLASSAAKGIREAMAKRIEAGENVTFTKPTAIKLAKGNPYYVTKQNPDGTLSVLKILSDQEAKQAAAKSAKLSNNPPLTGPRLTLGSSLNRSELKGLTEKQFKDVDKAYTKFVAGLDKGLVDAGSKLTTLALNLPKAKKAEQDFLLKKVAKGGSILAEFKRVGYSLEGNTYSNGGVENPTRSRPSDFSMTPEQQANYALANGQGPRQSRLTLSAKQKRYLREGGRLDRAQRQQRNNNIAFGAAVALPFAAGFVEPGLQSLGIKTGGGTAGGIASGIASGAAQGSSFGVFGPQAGIVGAVIGALVGGFGKLNKSIEELSAEAEHSAEVRARENDALDRAVTLQEQLNDARKNGESPALIEKLEGQFREARSGIVDSNKRDILNISDPAQQQKAIAKSRGEDTRVNAIDQIGVLLKNTKGVNDFSPGGGNAALAKEFATALSDSDALGLSDEKLLKFAQIAAQGTGGAFNRRLAFGAADTEANNRADEGFVSAISELSDVVGKFGLKVSDLTRENIGGIAGALYRSSPQSRQRALDNQKPGGTPYNGLPTGAFLSAGNSDTFFNAARANRTQLSGSTSRGQANFGLYQELISSGAAKDETSIKALFGEKDFNRNKALTQGGNLGELLASYLNGLGYKGGVRNNRGEVNLGAASRLLGQSANSGSSSASTSAALNELAKKAIATKEAAGLKGLDYAPAFDPRSSGLGLGINYGSFAKSLKRGGAGYITSSDVAGVAAERSGKRGGYLDRFTPGFRTMKDVMEENQTHRGKFDLRQLPNAPAAGRNGSISQETLDKADIAAGKEAAKQIQVNVNIDGALNLIAQGMDPQLATLINTKVNQAVIDATSQYFKDVQPQLTALNAQVAALNGKPLPPTPKSSVPPLRSIYQDVYNGVNKVMGIDPTAP